MKRSITGHVCTVAMLLGVALHVAGATRLDLRDLKSAQEGVRNSFADMEAVYLKLATELEGAHPEKADRLRRAVQFARAELIPDQLAAAVKALAESRVQDAMTTQSTAEANMVAMLEFLMAELAKSMAEPSVNDRELEFARAVQALAERQQQLLDGNMLMSSNQVMAAELARMASDLESVRSEQRELAMQTKTSSELGAYGMQEPAVAQAALSEKTTALQEALKSMIPTASEEGLQRIGYRIPLGRTHNRHQLSQIGRTNRDRRIGKVSSRSKANRAAASRRTRPARRRGQAGQASRGQQGRQGQQGQQGHSKASKANRAGKANRASRASRASKAGKASRANRGQQGRQSQQGQQGAQQGGPCRLPCFPRAEWDGDGDAEILAFGLGTNIDGMFSVWDGDGTRLFAISFLPCPYNRSLDAATYRRAPRRQLAGGHAMPGGHEGVRRPGRSGRQRPGRCDHALWRMALGIRLDPVSDPPVTPRVLYCFKDPSIGSRRIGRKGSCIIGQSETVARKMSQFAVA